MLAFSNCAAIFQYMKAIVVLCTLLAANVIHAAELNQLTAEEKAAGWKLLFNGKDTSGWRQYGKPSPPGPGWKVENGILKKLAKKRGGDIITMTTFNDFEFYWEWRLEPKANNGIKYLVTEGRPNGPGHEYQMIDEEGGEDIGRQTHLTASFYDVLPPDPNKPLRKAGEWNFSRVIIKGNHVEHWLNGVKVLAYELGSPEVKAGIARSKFRNARGFGDKIQGHIMLTDHGDEAWFRNVKIRELN